MKTFLQYITENNPYDWKQNYGKRFKIAVTPPEQSGGKKLVSVVTPANKDAWNWPEAHPRVIRRFKKNWSNIQTTLAPHKRKQIETGEL